MPRSGAAASPNGRWRPSKRSHGQRPPTPSIRLHDEAGCHNDPASAVPAHRPMVSTISNTFADYNIDLEEEEDDDEEESTAANSSAEDEEGYVIQVKPLPKIRLDLCPSPREEDEDREQNRHRKKKSRRRSSNGRSSTDKSSPSKSKERKGGGASDVGTPPEQNSSVTSTTVTTDKTGNNGHGADATGASAVLFLRRQNDQEEPPRPSEDNNTEHAKKDVAVDNAMVDADGFPLVANVLQEHDRNESSTMKDVSSELAPMFAPSPSPALAIHQGTISHPSGIAGSLPNSNAAVAPSVEYKDTKEQETNARLEKGRTRPIPDSIADAVVSTSPRRRSPGENASKKKSRLTKLGETQTRTPNTCGTEQNRQDKRSRYRRSESKNEKDADEDDRNTEDEEDLTSPIFDWLLMVCGDVSSFLSESCMDSPKKNGTDRQKAKRGKQNEERDGMQQSSVNGRGQYDLDHFKW